MLNKIKKCLTVTSIIFSSIAQASEYDESKLYIHGTLGQSSYDLSGDTGELPSAV